MVLTAGANADSARPAKNLRSVHCRRYLLSARRPGMILADYLVHGERSSTRAVGIEFG